MAWFKKVRKPIEPRPKKPAGCPKVCGSSARRAAQVIYNKDLAASLQVCPKCAHHFRIGATERLQMLFDGEWTEHDAGLRSTDPLKFTDTKPYRKRLDATHRGHRPEGRGHRRHRHARRHRDRRSRRWSTRFIGGSMGVVVGEKITRGDRAGDRAAAAGDHRLLLGRRAHDGRRAVADADGEDQRRARRGSIARGCPTSRS